MSEVDLAEATGFPAQLKIFREPGKSRVVNTKDITDRHTFFFTIGPHKGELLSGKEKPFNCFVSAGEPLSCQDIGRAGFTPQSENDDGFAGSWILLQFHFGRQRCQLITVWFGFQGNEDLAQCCPRQQTGADRDKGMRPETMEAEIALLINLQAEALPVAEFLRCRGWIRQQLQGMSELFPAAAQKEVCDNRLFYLQLAWVFDVLEVATPALARIVAGWGISCRMGCDYLPDLT